MRGKVRLPDPPLTGTRVLAFAPADGQGLRLTTAVLDALGADVVLLERPCTNEGSGPATGTQPGSHTRSQSGAARSAVVDLAVPAGQDVAARLAGVADVVIEGLAAGEMERFGLGAGALASRNPRLVLCSAPTRTRGTRPPDSRASRPPRSRLPGNQDAVVHAMATVASSGRRIAAGTGAARVAVGELAAALADVIAIIAALREDAPGGRLRRVDLGAPDALVSVLAAGAATQIVGPPAAAGPVLAASSGQSPRLGVPASRPRVPMATARLRVRAGASALPAHVPARGHGGAGWGSRSAGALSGQHTGEVIGDWLGCCTTDVEKLLREGAFG